MGDLGESSVTSFKIDLTAYINWPFLGGNASHGIVAKNPKM